MALPFFWTVRRRLKRRRAGIGTASFAYVSDER
jgi:hypothetical protein